MSTLTRPQTRVVVMSRRCRFLHCESKLSLYTLLKDEDMKSQCTNYTIAVKLQHFVAFNLFSHLGEVNTVFANAYSLNMWQYPLGLTCSSESQPVRLINY